MERKLIPVEKIVPNEWNPNEQDPETFDLLVESMKTDGVLRDILVRYFADRDEYEIVQGEWTWRAAKVNGIKELWAIVATPEEIDDDKAKELSVRLNEIRGKLNIRKLIRLIESQKAKYSKEEMQKRFGIKSSQFEKIYRETAKNLPEYVRKDLEKVKDEIQTVDQLMEIIRDLMKKHGETIKKNRFIFFTIGKSKAIKIRCNDKTWRQISEIAGKAKAASRDINEYLAPAFSAVLEEEQDG